jgi:hypothetical protein
MSSVDEWKNDIGAVKCIWVKECDCWCDTGNGKQ